MATLSVFPKRSHRKLGNSLVLTSGFSSIFFGPPATSGHTESNSAEETPMATQNHQISLADAIAFTTRARNAGTLLVHAWQFDRGIIDQILAQPTVSGVRIYVGLDAKNAPNLVIVGTDAANKDVTSGVLAEFGLPCPPWCDAASVLLTGA
jgi:hypothetical protein